MPIRIEIKAQQSARKVAEAGVRVRNAAPLYRVIGTKLHQSTLRNFMSGGWYPKKWKQSIRARTQGGRTLVEHAGLQPSINVQATPDMARIGTPLIYGRIHQLGGTIRAKNAPSLRFRIGDRWSSKKSVTIPARPFLPIDKRGRLHESDLSFITTQTERWITEGQA